MPITNPNPQLAHLNVAVVDDDTTLLGMLNEILSEEGYVVSAFTDGAELQKAVQQQRFDIVVTDINMPNVTGIELIRYLREVGSKAEVIIMTANAALWSAVEAVRLGAFDYLIKPFEDISLVVQLVHRAADKILGGRRQEKLVQAVIEKTKQLVSLREPTAENVDLVTLILKTEQMVKGLQQSETLKQGEGKLSGAVEELGLPNLLQMLAIVGKAGVLQIKGQDWEGSIWFRDGRILHAEAGRVRGAKAVFRMLLREKGAFHFMVTEASPPQQEIQVSTDGLILECLRQVDEWKRLGRRVPPQNLVMRLKKMPSRSIYREDRSTLELILRYSRVQEILDYSPVSDLETVYSLIRLRIDQLLDIYLEGR